MIEYLHFFNNTFGKAMYHVGARIGLLDKKTAYCIKGQDWMFFFDSSLKKWVVTNGKCKS